MLKKKKNHEALKKINIKKKHKALINVIYENGVQCSHDANIRFHGDFLDHINMINGTPIPSLRVKLNTSHINNITRFILFRPMSRYFDSEILSTTLYRNLGFMSPRTFKVKVEINGVETDYLFQENLKKEFLEFNSRVEGPILESNEDYHNYDIFQLSRISNSEWIKKDYIKKLTSLEALRFYNMILLKSKKFFTYDELIRFDPDDFDEITLKKIAEFDALTFATDNDHLLTFYNRRFYFDPIRKSIEPIYYDGSSKILSEINYDVFTGEYKQNLFNYQKMTKLNFDRIDGEALDQPYYAKKNYNESLVTNIAKVGAEPLIKKISELDRQNLLIELKNNGFQNINIYQLNIIFEKILGRLNQIKESELDQEIDFLKIENQPYKSVKTKEKINLIFLKDKNILNCLYNASCMFTDDEIAKFEIESCDQNLENCIIKKSNPKITKALIEQKKITKNYDIFLSMDKKEYLGDKVENFKELEGNSLEKIEILKDVNIFHNSYVKVNFDKKLKKIIFYYQNSLGKVLILDSELKNLNFSMINNSDFLNDEYKKNHNLTGCLTILNSNLKNIAIDSKDFYCEDTINFIKSNGSIKSINILNSNSDAIDADFSSLQFDKIVVENSKNDCVDVSFGDYEIKKAELNNCGDKGVSVGEKSNLILDDAIVKKTNIGIASKDSSITKISNLKNYNVDLCLSSYKKKQEFDGGYIFVKKFQCKDYKKKINYDEYSSIDY